MTDITLPPLPGGYATETAAAMRNYARAAVEADRQGREEPAVWKPIETAPKDNKRLLYLARLDDQGKLVELDFDGVWEYWQESWELSHINGYCWMSANGIEEPTHWAYQDEPPPTPPQPAASAKPWKECRHCGWECRPNKSESGWKPLAAPVAQEPVGVVCKAGPMYAPDTTMALFFAGEVPVGTKLHAASVAPHVCVAMPTLNDAMRAVLRNEHDVYATPEDLYIALCEAAEAQPSAQDREDAERMDWLDRVAHCADWLDEEPTKRVIRASDGAEFTGDTWREAIDAARAAKGADHG